MKASTSFGGSIAFSYFDNIAASTIHRGEAPWSAIVHRIENVKPVTSKAACALIKLAEFGDVRSSGNSLRNNQNVLSVSGVEGDYDAGEVSPEAGVRRLEQHRIRAVVYTSPSHTEEKPRWRVLAPLSRPHLPADRRLLLARLNGALGGILAPESFTLSQSYYIGRIQGSTYKTLPTFDDPDDGTPIDQLDALDAIAVYPVNGSTHVAPGEDGSAIGAGSRNRTLTSIAGRLRRDGLSPVELEAALLAVNRERCTPPLSDDEVRSIARSVGRYEPKANNVEQTTATPWPAALASAALHGIAGEFVQMIEPETEADQAAILMQFLVAFGSLVGRGPHYRVEATNHHANLFALLVGQSSKARKGTAWARVLEPFQRIEGWKPHVSGLSSGEGLKYHVRDPREEKKTTKKGERVTEITDDGVQDKRLLVTESEFASALRSVQRPGNTLSATVREAWDSGNLRTLTKNDPITATGAHISIVGHITADELRAELTATDCANGFANRFLFVAVKRSKLLPFGGDEADEGELQALIARLNERAVRARARSRITMTPAARAVWSAVYDKLSEGGDGLHGSVTARAEAQCVRLALVYALLDGAEHIHVPHLKAALAIWMYCDATARHIFGASLGDRVADEIQRRLVTAGSDGMTRTDISHAFGRHVSADRIGAALDLLLKKGKVRCEVVRTAGRNSELWKAEK